MAKFDLKAYARQGAAARVADLQSELAAIFRAFPELRKGNLDDPFTRRQRSAAGPRRKRKGMSAAQRAEVSKRMKAYWAGRRAKKGS